MTRSIHPNDRHNANPENINHHIKMHQNECDELACDLRGLRSNARDVYRGADDILINDYANRIKVQCGRPEALNSEIQALEWMLQRLVQEAAMALKDAGLALEKCRNIRLGTETVEALQNCMGEMEDGQ